MPQNPWSSLPGHDIFRPTATVGQARLDGGRVTPATQVGDCPLKAYNEYQRYWRSQHSWQYPNKTVTLALHHHFDDVLFLQAEGAALKAAWSDVKAAPGGWRAWVASRLPPTTAHKAPEPQALFPRLAPHLAVNVSKVPLLLNTYLKHRLICPYLNWYCRLSWARPMSISNQLRSPLVWHVSYRRYSVRTAGQNPPLPTHASLVGVFFSTFKSQP